MVNKVVLNKKKFAVVETLNNLKSLEDSKRKTKQEKESIKAQKHVLYLHEEMKRNDKKRRQNIAK